MDKVILVPCGSHTEHRKKQVYERQDAVYFLVIYSDKDYVYIILL